MTQLTQDQATQVNAVFSSYSIPRSVWFPIMLQESGGDTRSHATVGEDSRGLFQINVQANPQYSNVDLYDPVKNATIAAKDFISGAYGQAKSSGLTNPGDITAYVWKNGIKPNWDIVTRDKKDIQIKAQANLYAPADQVFTGAGTPVNPSPSTTITPTTSSGGNVTTTSWFNPLSWVGYDSKLIQIVWIIVGFLLLAFGLYVAFNPLSGGISSIVKGAIENE